ncbi:MAG TPA: hypothetical protein VN580_03510, partial [Clostridia bacterium]|nr:hypothetical protein [Clostridia bacterium]
YKINVDGIEYKFYGGLQNGDLELELPEREIAYDGLDDDENYVEVYRANGEKLDTEKGNDHFKIKQYEFLKNGELLYMYVIRRYDGVIIYGTRIKIEGMPEASSSKEITGFGFLGLEDKARIMLDQHNCQ